MKNKRGKEWGTGWDGKSRVPDKQYKENYDSIDWSNLKDEKQIKKNIDIYIEEHKKIKKQTLPPDVLHQMNWVLKETKLENRNEIS
jgi:hypothetical protein